MAVTHSVVLVVAGLCAAVSACTASLNFFLAIVFHSALWALASSAVSGDLSIRAAAIVLAAIGIRTPLEIMNRNAEHGTTYLFRTRDFRSPSHRHPQLSPAGSHTLHWSGTRVARTLNVTEITDRIGVPLNPIVLIHGGCRL